MPKKIWERELTDTWFSPDDDVIEARPHPAQKLPWTKSHARLPAERGAQAPPPKGRSVDRT